MTPSRITAYIFLTAVAAIWGFAVPIIKVTLESFPPITFLAYRFFITSIILLPILFVVERPKLKIPKKETLMIIASGLLGSSINLGLLFWGLDNTTSLSASLLSSIVPLMTVIVAAFFLHEHVIKHEKIGMSLAFLATLTFIAVSSLTVADTTRTLFGDSLILISNFALVAYIIITKKLLKLGYSPFFLTSTMFAIGAVSMLPIALLEQGSITSLVNYIRLQNLGAQAGVWYMAIFSGAIAYYLYQQGQKRIEAGEAVIFNYLVPFFTAPLAFFWLKEAVNLPMIISIVIIGIGVFIAEYRKGRRKIVD